MSAEYFAVEYCLHSGLVLLSGGRLAQQPLGKHHSDKAAVLAATELLDAKILQANYIGRDQRRWMVFNENEYLELLIELGV